jgi:hypothetical protein
MNESRKQATGEEQKPQGNELALKRTNSALRYADKCSQNKPMDPEILVLRRAWKA